MKFHNIHAEEGIGTIIGNGPSLRDVPDKFLRKYPSFGTNLIGIRFNPTYYFSFGGDHINNLARQEAIWENIDARRTKAVFVNNLFYNTFKAPKVWSLIDWWFLTLGWGDKRIDRMTWSMDPFRVVGSGFTTTYMEMQFAFFMGIRTLLCVGLDGHYDVTDKMGQHFYEQGGPDAKYDPPPYPWNDPKIWAAQCDTLYHGVRGVYEANGGRVINLTPGSAHKTLEFGNLEDWI